MKLRSGKNYESFRWSRAIYISQQRASTALLKPIQLLSTPDNINLYINPSSSPYFKIGLDERYLLKLSPTQFISRVTLSSSSSPYYKYLFLSSLQKELKKAGITSKVIY